MKFHRRLGLTAVLSIGFLLTSCSPPAYQVNPDVSESNTKEEDKPDNYMRIIGDLRWDELTSPDEWMARFPDCFEYRTLSEGKEMIVSENCPPLTIGGINVFFRPYRRLTYNFAPRFLENPNTNSGTMTNNVYLYVGEENIRAFAAAIKQTYPPVLIGNQTVHCSQYTCWNVDMYHLSADANGNTVKLAAILTPTPYTISLLDNVKIDTSEF